jgi:pimeloyl-ACP methyl ester carboxylesterase
VGGRLIGGLAVREWGDPAEPGILLWPGLNSTGDYFASLSPALPGRGVAVDPPGFGASAPLDPCTSARLVEVARDIVDACGCRAVVGHSLGAYVAVGVAANPPAALEAAVLIDGGFLTPEDFAELGMPVTAGRAELAAWMEAQTLHFPDWDSAFTALSKLIGGEVTPALKAYVRDVFAEVDGEIRERARPERMADLVLGVLDQDVLARASGIGIPTLLIACGEPRSARAIREKAWTRLAAASPLIELEVVEGWRHNPILQDPARASSMIAGWLENHLQGE